MRVAAHDVVDPASQARQDSVVRGSRTKCVVNRRWHCLALALGATVTSLGGGVARGAEPTHPAVAEAIERVREARGPQRYTALRALWKTWDQADPTAVEQALVQAAGDAGADVPSRTYAALLAAYARRRRGDLDGARARVRALGYVDRWLVLGPFDNDGRSGLGRAFEPETEPARMLDLQQPFEGKERPVRWRAVPPETFPYGWFDFGDLLRPREKICAYATTFVRSTQQPARRRAGSVWIGVAGAFKLFWNGEEVLSDGGYRDLDADRMAVDVNLEPGWNRLMVKVCGDESAPVFSLRLADARGAPDPSIAVSVDVAAAQEAARNATRAKPMEGVQPGPALIRAERKQAALVAPRGAPKRARPIGPGRGPLQQFEQAASRKAASPEVLEAYARYLLITGGDDPTQNLARDLIGRAAEQAPTVSRLLLAASLAEDRNQERQWVENAAATARDPKNVKVLLAQARLARRGANWRDAIPFFDRVLRVDPDNAEAILGRVDLFNEAGLKRTALVLLERAIERNPRAVGLLSAYAAQLAALDRQTEADEISDRYLAYRFDDGTQHAWRIRLAVARRDPALAEHWISRMLATDPGSSHNLGTAAHAYRSLGQTDKALTMFRKALALAPEDTDTMKNMADLLAEIGHRSEQLELLRKVLVLRPQMREVREYVDHIEPSRPRIDEAYAWEPERFLGFRNAPAGGFNQRTLRELHVTTVYESGLSSRFHQIVYQPLTDEAAATAREYAFTYQADRQSVQLRASRIFRADGRVDEATESSEGPNDNPDIAMYTSSRAFYVHFPKVNAGDVVELRYWDDDVIAQNVFADYFGEVVYLQSSQPVLNAEYVIVSPASRPLHFDLSPLPGLVREDKSQGSDHITRLFAPAITPLLPEPTMPPWSEVLGHVHVSTYRSWDDVGRWYWGLAKDQLLPDDEVRTRVDKILKGLTTEQDKVRAIYEDVVKQTRYVALEFGIYGFKPRKASQTFARGWGDCKDKAALIVTMLRVAGIPASMVLVRSGMRGDFPTQPASLAPFDHAIAYVPSLDWYLDGTAQYAGAKELPSYDRGALALVVGETGSKLVHLPDPPADQTQRTRVGEAIVNPTGSAQIDMRVETTGALAAQWRERYHGAGTRRDRVARDVAAELPGFELAPGAAGVEAGDLEDLSQPARVRIRGKVPSFGRKEGTDLSIPVTLQERCVPNLASLSQRHQDIRLQFQSTLDDTWTVRVPAGLTIKSIPVPAKATTPFGVYELTVDRKDAVVTVRSKMTLQRTRITPSEYQAFQSFCEETDRAFGQRLVVGKGK